MTKEEKIISGMSFLIVLSMILIFLFITRPKHKGIQVLERFYGFEIKKPKNMDRDATTYTLEDGKITSLSLSGRGINDISVICDLISLKFLVLGNNLLTSIPRNIGNLDSLISLELNKNQLTSLPKEFCDLSNLKNL